MILIRVDLPAPFSPRMAWMRPAMTVEIGLLQRPHAAIALGDALHAEERSPAASILVLPADDEAPREDCRGGAGLARSRLTGSSSVWPMISCAVKLMPQVGKALPTKKLSDWSG